MNKLELGLVILIIGCIACVFISTASANSNILETVYNSIDENTSCTVWGGDWRGLNKIAPVWYTGSGNDWCSNNYTTTGVCVIIKAIFFEGK